MAIIAAYMVPHPPMIVPEVGRGSERQVEATRTAYLRAAEDIAALQPETVAGRADRQEGGTELEITQA